MNKCQQHDKLFEAIIRMETRMEGLSIQVTKIDNRLQNGLTTDVAVLKTGYKRNTRLLVSILSALIIITLSLIVNKAYGQNYISFKQDSIIVSWDRVDPDYVGEVIGYEIVMVYHHDTNINVFNYATLDTFQLFNLVMLEDGVYLFGVRAFDDSGNSSGWLWSDSVNNQAGEWIFRRDTSAPKLPIRLNFNQKER